MQIFTSLCCIGCRKKRKLDIANSNIAKKINALLRFQNYNVRMAERTKALVLLPDHFIFEGSNPVWGTLKSNSLQFIFRFLFFLNLKSNSWLLYGVNWQKNTFFRNLEIRFLWDSNPYHFRWSFKTN